MPPEKPTGHWYRIDQDLGQLPVGDKADAEYPIPSVVVHGALRILVYARIETGQVKTAKHHEFKIFVEDPDTFGEAAFYLVARTYPQSAYGYNSENFWLPMPSNPEYRKLKVERLDAQPVDGSVSSNLKITYADYGADNR